jgi:hypothetical protein
MNQPIVMIYGKYWFQILVTGIHMQWLRSRDVHG